MGRSWVLLIAAAACTAGEPAPTAGEVAAEFGGGVTGAAAAPAVDTDQVPVFELAAAGRDLDIAAVDAVVDADTGTLVWLDARGALWAAPLERAPDRARRLADDVILGLAASHGRVAFARRVDGPETAPFVAELATGALTALDDGPGPDEVLGFSPDGTEVLLLSGRTGIASLFSAATTGAIARQLTNVGLTPGPGAGRARFEPPPAHRADVTWTAAGLRYRAGGATVEVRR